jgi:hypothetical protein
MQQEQPFIPAERANWLPTPAGDFRPVPRTYEPDAAVFDGRYDLPVVLGVCAGSCSVSAM